MTFLLQHVNDYDEKWFFVSLGAQWPHRQSMRLIERTTQDVKNARVFETEQQATETLEACGKPAGWKIVEVP